MSSCPHFISFLYSGSCLWFVCLYPPNFFQVRTLASAGGPDNLVLLDPAKYKARPRVPEPAGDGSTTHPKWQVGEQEYEALMRMLDNLVSTKKRGNLLQGSVATEVCRVLFSQILRHCLKKNLIFKILWTLVAKLSVLEIQKTMKIRVMISMVTCYFLKHCSVFN